MPRAARSSTQRLTAPARCESKFIPTPSCPAHEPFFCRHSGLYKEGRCEPDMAINSLRNKPFGPGGGTRRLHQSEYGGQKSEVRMQAEVSHSDFRFLDLTKGAK